MKILVVCQHYWPEPYPLPDVCEELVQRGHQVQVITGVPNYPLGHIYPGYQRCKKRNQIHNGVKIHRTFTIGRRNNIVFRCLNYFSFAFSSLLYAAEIQKNMRNRHSNASNSFQWNIIDGLCSNLNSGISVFNALPVGTWPRGYSKAILPDSTWTLNDSTCYEIGCINLPLLKQWSRYRRLKKKLKNIRNEELLLCTTYMPFLWALSKLDKSNHLTMIVTDLPQYADMHHVSTFRKWLRSMNNRLIYHFMKRVDRFVLLTEQMKEPLDVGSRPYVVMEGIYGLPQEYRPTVHRKRAILYSGRLNARYGVQNLLEAFLKLNDDTVELWICGSGEMEETIKAKAMTNSRIKFLGFQNQEDVWKMQREVCLLVNPRQNIENFTRYSFPSKTMEYLASGTPVLMYKLDGIPAEYDEHLYYVNGNAVEDLTAAIKEIINANPSELEETAKKAQEFIMLEKNAVVQSKKILALLQ